VPSRIATGRITQFDQAKTAREDGPVADATAASVALHLAVALGQLEEYAHMVVFLASERTSYVTEVSCALTVA